MKPLVLEVIAPIFEGVGLCTSCELVLSEAGVGEHPAGRSLDEYPQDWQDDYRRLSDYVFSLAGRYGDRLLIRVIDPQSPQGLLKSLRHWVRRYPTFIVGGHRKIVGWRQADLEAALSAALESEGR